MNWNPTNWLAEWASPRDTGIPPDPEKPAIVLVHGIYDTGSKMAWLAAHFRRAGYEVFCPDLLPSDGTHALPLLSGRLGREIDGHFGPERVLLPIGYSMGGLIVRHWLQQLDSLERIAGFATIGSPHNGTHTARLVPVPGVRDMLPGSGFLRELEAGDSRLHPLRPLSVYTPLDLIIVPATSSEWRVATVRCVWTPAHLLLVFSPAVFRLLEAYCHSQTPRGPRPTPAR